MTKTKKSEVFHEASYDFKEAKDRLNSVVQRLEENGLVRDADTLYGIILRIEAFQTKYDEFRL